MATSLHHRRADCRLCGSLALQRVLELTPTPPANAFVTDADKDVPQQVYPLDVYRCGACGHLQLADIIDPTAMFSHYVYVSSTSPVMVAYLEGQCRAMITRLGLQAGDFVVEIGSNDGTLLRFFKAAGMRVLGVDPAANVAPNPGEIENVREFFCEALGKRIRSAYGAAKLVCAYNVCAHIDDLRGVIAGVRELLDPTGHFVLEVGYLLDIYRKTLFDTIYHEHVDFHHVEPLRRFFFEQDLRLLHVEHSDIQGGALVAYVGWQNESEQASVAEMIAVEHAAGLDRADTFMRWGEMIRQRGDELMSLLAELKGSGKSIAAYGATAKSTTMMYHYGLDASILDYVVDDNPIKQGMFTPGLHLPVHPPARLYRDRPDYVLILAWNFAESIMGLHEALRAAGCHFIIPLPRVEVV